MRNSRAHLFALLLLHGCASPGGTLPTVPLTYYAGPFRQHACLHLTPPRQAGRGPAVVLLHGGFFGVDRATSRIASELARRSILSAVPSYRGEGVDGLRSEGRIEFCAGEVDDAAALVEYLRARGDVDPERIALWGFSHGGCVALQLASRDPRIRAVVTFSAPTDARATYEHLRDHPFRSFGFNGWLSARLQSFVGGSPERYPERWHRRSPLHRAAQLTQALLLVHGVADQQVPVEQACLLARALRAGGREVFERRFDEKGSELPDARPLCQGGTTAAPAPTGTPVELWLLSGQGHVYARDLRLLIEGRVIDHLAGLLSSGP